jgi:putative intracellular protease/amidase
MPGKRNKASAIEEGDEVIDVLFILHEKFDLVDLAGPLEVFNYALTNAQKSDSKAFECTIAGPEDKVISKQGVSINSQISYKDAHESLDDYDVVVVLGGNSEEILKRKDTEEPLALISAFAKLQQDDNSRERTLFSVCTGSLFLAKLNLLSGLSATTHPNYLTKFEILCSEAAQRNLTERTDVMDDARYVVNNLRFDVGEDGDENPYVRRGSDAGRRPSNARWVFVPSCPLFFFSPRPPSPPLPRANTRLSPPPQQGQHLPQELGPPRVDPAPRRHAPRRAARDYKWRHQRRH